MAMPVTRPIVRNQTTYNPGQLARPGGAAALALPPSQGTSLPGGGTLHTVKDPGHQVPQPRRRIVGAQ